MGEQNVISIGEERESRRIISGLLEYSFSFIFSLFKSKS